MEELSCGERQHVLPALEQSRPCDIIDARLGLVEGLERILLGVRAADPVRLDEASVEEKPKSLKKAGRLVACLWSLFVQETRKANPKTEKCAKASEDEFVAVHL